MVHRSAFELELLTYQPTGALVAPTCSLPESIGVVGNWEMPCLTVRCPHRLPANCTRLTQDQRPRFAQLSGGTGARLRAFENEI
jgi:hypothetical protein